MERKTIEENKNGVRDYAVLVGLRSPVLGADSADEESLAELSALVETAGAESVGTILQNREKPDPHSFIGEGKVEEVKRMVENSDATMVIFDNDLSPSQIRVLTELCGVQVLDRSGLILDIFAQRARTKEGCLQVELAQYQYLLPRLIGMWSHLERQGGTGGSPIGTKGPGETQLETDRRHIRRKIDKLKEELEEVRRVRATQRQRRQKNEIPVVAIVGYTNAGKSTLLNTLGCLDTPTSGEYLLDGISVRTMSKPQRAVLRNRKIGFVFQSYNLLPKTTAVENVELPLMYNSAVSASERRRRAIESLQAVGLGDRLEHKSNQMSGGQMQRVAIARALVNNPAVILADEATGNLDTRTSFEILVLFQKLHAEGRTIIFVTHNPEIAQYSSRNIRLRDGHITEDTVNTKILSAAEALAALPKNEED